MRKHRPPSQIRYEKSHPTISFRLDRELKERLEKVLEGKSFADFVKEGLGVREREKKSLEEEHNIGYDEGYEKAKNKYLVQYPCAVCGETLYVTTDKEKKEIVPFMRSKGWGHQSCLEAQRKKRELWR